VTQSQIPHGTIKMVLPNHIEEAERIGMPAHESVKVECDCMRSTREEDVKKCTFCGRKVCPRCWRINDHILEYFCSVEVTDITGETHRYPSDCEIDYFAKILREVEDKVFELEKNIENLGEIINVHLNEIE